MSNDISRSFAGVYDGHNGAKAAEHCSSRWAWTTPSPPGMHLPPAGCSGACPPASALQRPGLPSKQGSRQCCMWSTWKAAKTCNGKEGSVCGGRQGGPMHICQYAELVLVYNMHLFLLVSEGFAIEQS